MATVTRASQMVTWWSLWESPQLSWQSVVPTGVLVPSHPGPMGWLLWDLPSPGWCFPHQ